MADSLKSINVDGVGYALEAYPVGSIYMSVNSTDPATLFGGSWERIQGRFLLGADSAYAAGSEGGEAEHTLTVNEMPSHSHEVTGKGTYFNGVGSHNYLVDNSYSFGEYLATTLDGIVRKTGGNQPHNNMPPYLAVYIWKRTA